MPGRNTTHVPLIRNGEGSALLSLYKLLISHGSRTHDYHPGLNILTVIYPLNNASSLPTMLPRVYRV